MQFTVQVEKPSSILRKMTIKVPADEVKNQFEKGLAAVQKTAQIKGFRKGQVPASLVKQVYGNDVRHRVLHALIDESFQSAVEKEQIRAVGRPKIETPDHSTGEGEHDHSLNEEHDFTFTATVEVMPEVLVKDYTGVALSQQKIEIEEDHVSKVVENLQNSQAELIPVSGGLALADGSQSSRPVQQKDFVDILFQGGVLGEHGVQFREDMKGSRVLEIGSNTFIAGFEDQLIGMRKGETKTFRIGFPQDYSFSELAGKDAEFTVTVNEVKEKKLPELDDEFAKQMGYENVSDLREKARELLLRERKEEADFHLRSELLNKIIEKNPFDVPQSLVDGQTRMLAQEWSQELKKQNVQEKTIQEMVLQELGNLQKRAESQVRASLILESVAKEEKIDITDKEVSEEIEKLSASMKVEKDKLIDFYERNPGRKDDLEFRLRQERTLKFLLDKAKVKTVAARGQ